MKNLKEDNDKKESSDAVLNEVEERQREALGMIKAGADRMGGDSHFGVPLEP